MDDDHDICHIDLFCYEKIFSDLYYDDATHDYESKLRLLAEKERDYIPKEDYLERLNNKDLNLSTMRNHALHRIWEVHRMFNFTPLTLCLSINYLDRFLSFTDDSRRTELSVEILAIACLSITSKIEGTMELSLSKLYEPEGYGLKQVCASIIKMELLVLNCLQWKMHACTPCSFICCFLKKIPYHQHTDTLNSSISRSMDLILNITKDSNFLEFKPSEIAAAVVISISREAQDTDIDEAIASFVIVQKDRVMKCVEMIRGLSKISSQNSQSIVTNK